LDSKEKFKVIPVPRLLVKNHLAKKYLVEISNKKEILDHLSVG
jgi:hypothetical protein